MEMKNDYRRMVRLNPFESGSVFKLTFEELLTYLDGLNPFVSGSVFNHLIWSNLCGLYGLNPFESGSVFKLKIFRPTLERFGVLIPLN